MKYYLHDTSAFDDEKVSELYIEFGYEGVGLFYVILEKLGKQEKPVKTNVLKKQLKVGKRLEKCWTFMEEIGLIHSNNGETFNKQLLNFSEKYQIKKEKTREKVAQWRKLQEDTENVTGYVPECNPPKVKGSKDNNKDIDKSIPTWRDDFKIYIAEASQEFSKLANDEKFLSEQQLFYPEVHLKKTMQKMWTNYWGTQAGWKKKKSSKTNNIDWKGTIVYGFSQSINKVYYTKQELAEIERR